ncbi:MAG: LuxR C-terminal-related transcriptional regulator [Defluviitaleaceae bacterium]|nr:LuxR C-terminal-related transcriptional regulator [Defluviitaleaceae bacterium]
MNSDNILLKRQNLIRIFDELKDSRVIVVCAPAGYGKTVAVSQWLSKSTRAKAIFSLDEYDNNLAGFCERFCVALRSCQPQNKTLGEIISHKAFQSSPVDFTLRAVAALSGRKQAVLVIDDLHLLTDDSVLTLLQVLIKRLPKNFQIIFISRHELSPEFSDLWLKEQIAVVDIQQLHFSDEEVKALYNKRGKLLTKQQAKDINNHTHGWAIGINASFMSDGESFQKTYDYMDNFVKKNIWEKWSETTREFMLHTVKLRELTPDICDAMTGISDSDKFLKELVQKGAFIAQTQKGVYRYHHLFQQFLLSVAEERGEDFLMSLDNTEGHWHLSQMDFYSAADCFIRSKNHDGIAKCFDLLGSLASNDYAIERLFPILKHPEIIAVAKKHPHLLYAMTFCAFAEERADDMISYLDEYYARYPDISAKNPEHAHNIFYMQFCDFRRPLSQTISEMEPQHGETKHMPTLHLPMLHRSLVDFSEWAVGNVEENVEIMRERAGWLFGEERDVMFDTMLAGLLYEQGHIERAHEYALRANAEIKNHFPADIKLCAMAILVCTLDVAGEANEAERLIKSMSQIIEEAKAYHLNYSFRALIARRNLNKTSEEWLETYLANPVSSVKGTIVLTTCAAYIAENRYDSAIILLTKTLDIVSVFNRTADIIETHILLAIAYWKKKGRFQGNALEHLYSAVSLARPYGFVQMFVNSGAEINGMLYKLQKRAEQQKGDNTDFIRRLYLKIQSVPGFELQYDDKPIKFTDRQTTVMRLLCQGKTHKEIASILDIKTPSVSTHVKLIYNKLDVANVSDAVKKMVAMGLAD